MRTGYTLDTDDGLHVEALNPPKQPTLDASLDDNALVLRLTYGDVGFLLASELSAEGQQALIKSGQNLNAAVLQAPAELDAGFIQAVHPSIAVTQAQYPNEDDLALLGDVPLYRSERDGTLHLSSDGVHLWIDEVRQ